MGGGRVQQIFEIIPTQANGSTNELARNHACSSERPCDSSRAFGAGEFRRAAFDLQQNMERKLKGPASPDLRLLGRESRRDSRKDSTGRAALLWEQRFQMEWECFLVGSAT